MSDYVFLRRDADTVSEQVFEVFTYPVGETTVRVKPDTALLPGTQILRVNTSSPDWVVVAAWAAACEDRFPEQRRVLVVPFLPSARGDKDIPCPAAINAELAAAAPITDLVTIDPHSPVWLNMYREAAHGVTIHEIDTARVTFSALAVNAINEEVLTHAGGLNFDGPDGMGYTAVISPDAGARDRASAVADILKLPVLVAEKKRDPATGRILSYDFPAALDGGRVLVVDDICDGGGTFAMLANALPGSVEADLWVTHGGFTKGWKGTGLERYRTIFTTDSLPSAVKLWMEHPERNRVAMTYLDPFINEIIAGLK